MLGENKIYTTLEDGTKKEFDIILTFHNDDNNKDYVLYTDNSFDDEDKLKIYAGIYNVDTNEYIGNPTSQEEWVLINDLLESVFKEEN